MYVQGVGSRLMARMGYVVGQGLGKNSDGRAEPVPIQLLPQGVNCLTFTNIFIFISLHFVICSSPS